MALPTIKLGYDGMETQTLRGALANSGFHPTYSVTSPNLFDAWVDYAVKAYQKMNGLSVDGVVGPNTWNSLLGLKPTPSTTRGPPVAVGVPNTSSDPGSLPGGMTSIAPTGAPKDNTMLGVLLAAGAAFAWWLWFSKRKGGSTLAGLPFGASEEEEAEEAPSAKEAAAAKRRAKAQADEVLRQYEIELKRNEVDPERQPGWAARIKRVVERSVATENRLLSRAQIEQQERERLTYDPVARAAMLREQDADIRQRTPEERVQVASEIRRMRPELGHKKGLKTPAATYRTENTKVGRKLFPGNTNPTTGLRNRTDSEVERWAERVESARGAAQGTKRVTVQSKRYHTDKRYREGEQDDARALADKSGAKVQLVNERGVALFTYEPNARNFKDAESERLIAQVAKDAKNGNCPKAVRNLFRVRPLALDAKTEDLLDDAATAVAKNCEDQLGADIDEREEARNEAGQFTRSTAKRGELEASGLNVQRSRKKKAEVLTTKAIQRAIEKGQISEEDGKALLVLARDAERAARIATDTNYPGPRPTRYMRKRAGELPAIISTDTSGRKRTTRVK